MKLTFKSLLVGLTLLVTGVSQAAIVSVNNPLGVTVGDSFAVNVVIEDVSDFAGFQFLLGFDSTVLSATSVTSGDIFGLDTFLIDDTISSNSISFAETTFAITGLDIVGSTLLATINFDAIATGMTSLSLSNLVLSDSMFMSIAPVTINDSMVTVSPQVNVSAPATLSLLLASFGLFVAMRKK